MAGVAVEQRPLPVSTPARRPDTTASHTYTPLEPLEPAWTSSRCHRLLRPFTSRIAALRKRAPIAADGPDTATANAPPAKETTGGLLRALPAFDTTQHRGLKKSADSDPEWSPSNQPIKRVRRTYKSKGALASRCAMQQPLSDIQAQSSGIVDPLLVLRECALESSNPSDAEPAKRSRKRQRISHERFRNVARATSASDWTIYLQLYKALDSLLQFTKRHNRLSTGVDTMFNLCLKAVPAYIANEQALQADTDPDSQDQVSNAVYTDLESWGSTNGNGWKPFRVLVRSHAIAILCDAITDGTLPCRVAIELADLCFYSDAIEEGYCLCDALLAHMGPLPLPAEASNQLFTRTTAPELAALHDLTNLRSLWGYFFAKLTSLLQSGVIPVEWLSSKDMGDIWNRLILSITKGDADCPYAIALLQATTELICGISSLKPPNQKSTTRGVARDDTNQPRLKRLDTALTITLMNVLALLLAIGELSSTTEHRKITHHIISSFAVRWVAYQEAATLPVKRLPSPIRLRGSLVLFTYILLPALTSNDTCSRLLTKERGFEDFSALTKDQDVLQWLSDLVRSTALCCAKVDIDASWVCIQTIVAYVQNLSDRIAVDPGNRTAATLPNVLRRAATIAAVEYAEETELSEHLNWAYELEHVNANTQHISTRLCRCVQRSCSACEPKSFGFRWEEGIDEWVQKTPGIKTGQQISRRAKPVSKSPDLFDKSSSPVQVQRQPRASLAAFTDTPLPPEDLEGTHSYRGRIIDLAATPATPSRRPTIYQDTDEHSKGPEIGHLFDLSAELDDVDELSILTDQSINQSAMNSPRKHGPNPFTKTRDLSPAKPKCLLPYNRHQKSGSAEQRNRPARGSGPFARRNGSLDHRGHHYAKPVTEARVGLKRTFSNRESIDHEYSSSGDELAL